MEANMSSSNVSGNPASKHFREWYDALPKGITNSFSYALDVIDLAQKVPNEENIKMAFFRALAVGRVFACEGDPPNSVRYIADPIRDQSEALKRFKNVMKKVEVSNLVKRLLDNGDIPSLTASYYFKSWII